jgi:Zn-dependent peptidase ImmA (M78 family)
MSLPDDCFLDEHQLATVEKHAAFLLAEASALHVFPTPIDRLMAAAKLTVVDDEFLDSNMLAQFMRMAKSTITTVKTALSKILGMIHVTDRLVLIDKGVPPPKVPFIKLHEAAHGTLPHQSKVYSLIHDCEHTLDPDITELFEREANVFAAEVLFQGTLFAEEAHQSNFSMNVPINLSKKYGASAYSTFRRYVTTNPSACCLLVLDPVVRGEGKQFTANVRRIVTTNTFHTIFDGERFGSAISNRHILGHVVPVGRRMTAARKIKLTDRNGDQRHCTAEAFNSTHHIFLLIKDEGPAPTIILPSRTFRPHINA